MSKAGGASETVNLSLNCRQVDRRDRGGERLNTSPDTNSSPLLQEPRPCTIARVNDPGDLTQLLIEYGRGDDDAFERLIPLVYDELHMLARSHRYRWNGYENALGTTSIVHEAYMKLVDQNHVEWKSRSQFYCIASRAMRSVLIDNARAHQAKKRGGDRQKVAADDAQLVSAERSAELIALDEALDRLQETDDELGSVVECRFFGGLTIAETGEALSMSAATVKRRWTMAQIWLYKELQPG